MRKFLSIIGVLACLLAAEGLHRIGTFVGAIGGQDAPFYTGILIISLIAVVFFILALVGKLSSLWKWLSVLALGGSAGVMFFAPALPVIMQIVGSLIVAAVCMIFAPVGATPAPAEAATAAPSTFGKVIKYIVIAAIILVVALGVLGKLNAPDKPQSTTQQTQERTQQ